MAKPIDRSLLICPACRKDALAFNIEVICCKNCGQIYSILSSDIYCFVEPPRPDASFLGRIKETFKRFPNLYDFLITTASPVCPTGYLSRRRFLNDYLQNHHDAVVINLGSGVSDISDRISNVDIFAYPNVNLTCDITSLPFKDSSVDMVLNIAVLEHVPHPEQVVAEIFRVLKPGGIVYCFFPFMQGFHAAPFDFSRRTAEGLRVLFAEFHSIEIVNAGGPTSALLWILQEWIAIVLSLGLVPLYNVIHLLAMALLWPLKFIDFLLIQHPKAHTISSGFVVVGSKCSAGCGIAGKINQHVR